MNIHDLEVCKHPGCTKKVCNRARLCLEHRVRKCAHPGCSEKWAANTSTRYCYRHRENLMYCEDPSAMFGGKTVWA